jgi:hypothetical protein
LLRTQRGDQFNGRGFIEADVFHWRTSKTTGAVNLFADLLIAVAAIFTAILGYFLALPTPAAPDRAGLSVALPLLQTPRWICLTVLMAMCVARGAFTWPSTRIGIDCLHDAHDRQNRRIAALDWESCATSSFYPAARTNGLRRWFLNPALRDKLDPGMVRTVTNRVLAGFGLLIACFGVLAIVALWKDLAQDARNRTKRVELRRSGHLLVSGLGCALLSITCHDPIAENFVGRFHRFAVDREILLPGILGDQFQAELVIFELIGAQIAHGNRFLVSVRHQQIRGRFGKPNVQAMRFVETASELVHDLSRYHARLLFVLGENLFQCLYGIIYELAPDHEAFDMSGR